MRIWEIQLEAEGQTSSLAGYRLSAQYNKVTDSSTESTPVRIERSAVSDRKGFFQLEIDTSQNIKGDAEIKLVAPDGELLKSQVIESAKIGKPVTLKIKPSTLSTPVRTQDPFYNKPDRIRGRVLKSNGEKVEARVQVVLWGILKEGEEFSPLSHGMTDENGYFSASYPKHFFTEVNAVVGQSEAVAIPLDQDQTLPENIVLIVDSDTPLVADSVDDENGCGCEQEAPYPTDPKDLVESPETYSNDLAPGRCVDFTKPNRTLEEFEFHSVVRTTEPVIKGTTLADPPSVQLGTLIPYLEFDKEIKNGGALVDPSTRMDLMRMAPESGPTGTIGRGRKRSSKTSKRASKRTSTGSRTASGATTDTSPMSDSDLELLKLAARPIDRDEILTRQLENAGATNASASLEHLKKLKIDSDILASVTADGKIDLPRLSEAARLTRLKELDRLEDILRKKEPNRSPITCDNSVDWDDEPTFYQACTIAHGHILRYKQVWKANGYSLGDLLHSIPLGPCQKKQIAVVDWDRRESASRTEDLESSEELSSELVRDRDINEIINSTLTEEVTANSSASTSAFGAAAGIAGGGNGVFGFLGVAGGKSNASSDAWQESSRELGATSLQQLDDRTSQAASSVRTQRSTVVETIGQGETSRAQTEVLANHNHCHAVTYQYFEVLRHFLIESRIVDVQECLFVPFPMARFDRSKALRWKDTLKTVIRRRSLLKGFPAIQRISNQYRDSSFPVGSFGEQAIRSLNGQLEVKFFLSRPEDDDEGEFNPDTWRFLRHIMPEVNAREFWRTHLKARQDRDQAFIQAIGERLADKLVSSLKIVAVVDRANGTEDEEELPLKAVRTSSFSAGNTVTISLVQDGAVRSIRRDRIKAIRILGEVQSSSGLLSFADIVPPGTQVQIQSGRVSYRSDYQSDDLFRSSRLPRELISSLEVRIETPLSPEEMRNPRREDEKHASRLLGHLNEHLENYHKVIWAKMSPDRRYMLLDGFTAPNSGGRSVASVVENRLVGIVGNSLVFPVAPGFHLDPTYKEGEGSNRQSLLEHYQPKKSVVASRVSVPTKGVFAEAVMGSCNSCEVKDESRFWRWEESPCPDQPTPITDVNTDSRRSQPGDLTAKDHPNPIINLQNAPAAPDPMGLASALQVMSQPGIFKDITGLTENQKNALAAFSQTMSTALDAGKTAGNMLLQAKMIEESERTMKSIKRAKDDGLIDEAQASRLTEQALSTMTGGGPSGTPASFEAEDIAGLSDIASRNETSLSVDRGNERLQISPSRTEELEEALRRSVTGSSSRTPGYTPALYTGGGSSSYRLTHAAYSGGGSTDDPISHLALSPVGSFFESLPDEVWNGSDPATDILQRADAARLNLSDRRTAHEFANHAWIEADRRIKAEFREVPTGSDIAAHPETVQSAAQRSLHYSESVLSLLRVVVTEESSVSDQNVESFSSFLQGIYHGLTDEENGNGLDMGTIETLFVRNMEAMLKLNIFLPVVTLAGAVTGILKRLAEDISGMVFLLVNISNWDEIIEGIKGMIATIFNDPEAAQEMGFNLGLEFGAPIKDLAEEDSSIKFAFKLNMITGPLALDIVLMFIPAGGVFLALASKALKGTKVLRVMLVVGRLRFSPDLPDDVVAAAGRVVAPTNIIRRMDAPDRALIHAISETSEEAAEGYRRLFDEGHDDLIHALMDDEILATDVRFVDGDTVVELIHDEERVRQILERIARMTPDQRKGLAIIQRINSGRARASGLYPDGMVRYDGTFSRSMPRRRPTDGTYYDTFAEESAGSIDRYSYQWFHMIEENVPYTGGAGTYGIDDLLEPLGRLDGFVDEESLIHILKDFGVTDAHRRGAIASLRHSLEQIQAPIADGFSPMVVFEPPRHGRRPDFELWRAVTEADQGPIASTTTRRAGHVLLTLGETKDYVHFELTGDAAAHLRRQIGSDIKFGLDHFNPELGLPRPMEYVNVGIPNSAATRLMPDLQQVLTEALTDVFTQRAHDFPAGFNPSTYVQQNIGTLVTTY